MSTMGQPEVRTYSHWRRRESVGVRGLGTLGTAIVVFGGLGSTLLLLVSLKAGASAGLMTLLVIGGVTRRDRFGRSLIEKGAERLAWSRTKWQGWHIYRSGPLGVLPSGQCQLPGLAGPIEAHEAEDSLGRRFVVLYHPKTKHVTTVIRSHPDGLGLDDQETVDQRVGQYGQWLYVLGTESGLQGASVTIDASPDPGFRLRKEVEARQAENAPELSKEIIGGLATKSRTGVSQTSCWIALTWATKTLGGRDRSLDEVILEIGARLPNQRAMLAATGAGICHSMTATQLAAVMRSAYDPGIAATVQEVGADEADIGWESCGPLEAEEHVGFYTHDGWTSTTWEMGIAPRGQVRETVLARLLEPHTKAPVKRVTLLYRPYDSGESAKRVDADVDVAHTNLSSRGGRVRARDEQNLAAAKKAAAEEASGAGLTRFGLVVTVSVPGEGPEGQREV
ncbi:MAG: hypothetical protein M3063_07435, partial [Actinomycetota bacterium]|nr:hypothetical protein [Actinomycetota bacterium]